MKRLLLLLALLLLFVGCSEQAPEESLGEEPPAEEESSGQAQEVEGPVVGIEIGDIAPDFELDTLEGESIKLSELRGQPVHLVFWSVDCTYCVQELPHVQEIYNENKDDYNVLALNITIQDGKKTVEEFMAEEGYDFPVLLIEDTDQGLNTLQNYQVRGIPHNVFIASDGKIAYNAAGMMTEETIQAVLKELLD